MTYIPPAKATRRYLIAAKDYASPELDAARTEHGVSTLLIEEYYPGVLLIEAEADAKISQDEFGVVIDGMGGLGSSY